jgi:GrpB-like predicted nucleotidyltransferase (UPF0157 family)/ribosomal protein S18 acetylase RimI-like enzyme/catechol 2,3-dioxygenase-like lactoylglutathione lyase family enzyme
MRKVEVVEYRPEWTKAFFKEKELLKKILGDLVREIHHVGSTSVKDLAAKPIIDILIGVSSLEELDEKNDELIKVGYEPRGEYGIPGRRYFPKGGCERTHHIHAFLSNNSDFKRHLVFRDYLRAHKQTAQKYAQLKKKIAVQCNNSIEAYCDGKDGFVKAVEAEALSWYEKHMQAIGNKTLKFIEVKEPEKRGQICERILRTLPEWFGIESAIIDYIQNAKEMETIAVFAGEEACGFICLNTPDNSTAEVHVMGLLPHFHGKGVGSQLLKEAEKRLFSQGYRFLQVKTLSSSRPCSEYELTRKFYRKSGFYVVEEFSDLWGEENPCLQMIKNIKPSTGSLHHLEIYVSDLEKSTAFWSWFLCEKLGYKLFQTWNEGRSYILGDTYIVLVQAESRFLDIPFHRCRPGLNHLAFKAESKLQIDQITRELEEHGGKILYKDRHPYAGGDSYYALFFEDPERIKVELVL